MHVYILFSVCQVKCPRLVYLIAKTATVVIILVITALRSTFDQFTATCYAVERLKGVLIRLTGATLMVIDSTSRSQLAVVAVTFFRQGFGMSLDTWTPTLVWGCFVCSPVGPCGAFFFFFFYESRTKRSQKSLHYTTWVREIVRVLFRTFFFFL